METNFTKGEWFTDVEQDTILIASNTEDIDFIAKIPIHWKNSRYNAKLISASPIMYDYIYKKSINGDEDAKLILATIE